MIRCLLMALLLLGGCSGGGGATVGSGEREFKMVEIPVAINDPGARAEYLALHYWDNFDFADTSLLSKAEITEQAFANFLDVISHVDSSVVRRSIFGLLTHAEGDSVVFAYFNDIGERYLHDPNSPMRNEEIYIPMLEYVVASPKVCELMKIRPRELLKMALKNRPGARATNFEYRTIAGVNGRMHSIKSDYTLLFFNNPGCQNCKQITESIIASPVFERLLSDGKLSILAVYPDKEIAEWKNYAPNIPSQWINARDAECRISEDELYDLKAIPTLYLLDRDKVVMLKDATFEAVEAVLSEIDRNMQGCQ